MIALGAVVAVLKAKGVVSVNKRVAFFAACVIIVVTVRAKICVIIAIRIRFPDSRSAPVANNGILVSAVLTDRLAVDRIEVLVLNEISAV